LYGCKYGIVRNNTVRGVEADAATAYPTGYMLVVLDDYTGPVTCEHNLILNNFGDALRTAGTDSGANNSYIDNYVLNAVTSANFSVLGTDHFESRVDPATMMRGFGNPVGFADGDTTDPSIARRAQTTLGIRFGASLMGLVVSGADALRVDNSSTAGNTRLLVYDVDSGAVQRVKAGANGSGSIASHRMLQIPDA
jgi:hypothetical protein